jgi:hypothetical protein
MSDSVTDADPASADQGATATREITGEQHDWASSFCGVDTRASNSGSSGDGFLGALSSAASAVGNAVSSATSSVADAAGSVVSAAGDAAGAASSVVTAAESVAGAAVNAAESVAVTAGAGVAGAAGDAMSGVVNAGGALVNDASQIAAGMASAAGDAVSGVVNEVETVADAGLKSAGQAVDKDEAAASKAGKALESGASLGTVTDQFAQSAFDAGADVAHDMVNAAPLPDALKDAASTYVDFEKGVGEGVFGGVKGMVTGAVASMKMVTGADLVEGAAGLALSAAGDKMLSDVKGDIETSVASAEFMAKMATPIGQAEFAVQAVQGFEQASAQGHGAEYLGKGVGQIGVAVAAAVIGGEAAEPGEVPPGDTSPVSGGGGEPLGGGGGGEPPSGGGGSGGEPPGSSGGGEPPSSGGGGDEPPPSSEPPGNSPPGEPGGREDPGAPEEPDEEEDGSQEKRSHPKRSQKGNDPDNQQRGLRKAQKQSREIRKKLEELDDQEAEARARGDTAEADRIAAKREALQGKRRIIDSTKKSDDRANPNRRDRPDEDEEGEPIE